MDVFPDVIFYGILLVPNNLKPGEHRPVVVCQHGHDGRAEFTIEGNKRSYENFSARLAQRGFVVFAPQHLYRGGDPFRTVQRKANPLGKSIFSLMVAQHRQLSAWLGSLDFVDAKRIGFYGISYGGKSAMRIPAILEGYCLSICSSDFSDWIWRTVSNRHAGGYMLAGEYEIFEFNLGNTFNYCRHGDDDLPASLHGRRARSPRRHLFKAFRGPVGPGRIALRACPSGRPSRPQLLPLQAHARRMCKPQDIRLFKEASGRCGGEIAGRLPDNYPGGSALYQGVKCGIGQPVQCDKTWNPRRPGEADRHVSIHFAHAGDRLRETQLQTPENGDSKTVFPRSRFSWVRFDRGTACSGDPTSNRIRARHLRLAVEL